MEGLTGNGEEELDGGKREGRGEGGSYVGRSEGK